MQSPYLRRRLRLGEFLIAKGVISEEQLKTALERQKQTGDFLGEALISLSYISPPTLGSYMEELGSHFEQSGIENLIAARGHAENGNIAAGVKPVQEILDMVGLPQGKFALARVPAH